MNNADKFHEVFGIYATEMWAMSESKFLEWLSDEYKEHSPCLDCQEFDCYGCAVKENE